MKKFQGLRLVIFIFLCILVVVGFGELAVRMDQPAIVEAQGAGSANFTRTFSLAASSSAQYIPACTTVGANCIPNYGQVSHQVIEIFGTPGSAAACGLTVDGSGNNSIFYSVAAAQQGASLGNNPVAFASGYYPYVRIKALPCASSAQTIIYVGYASPVAQVSASNSESTVLAGAFTPVGDFYVPFAVTGMQVFNPNGSPAYFELDIATGTVDCSAVHTYNFITGIAAGQAFSYSGAALSPYALSGFSGTTTVCVAGFTTAGGSTPVSTPLVVNLQTTIGGPFYPFFPPSS